MRIAVIALMCLVAGVSALAQRHEITINTETPEGQLLQQIGQEEDDAKKVALIEQFATQYPKHEGLAWVYSQMIALGAKTGQHDKALDACGKLLAIDPKDARSALECLKTAEAKKDADAVKIWSARASEIARAVAQSPKPQSEDEVEEWKSEVDFAKQLDTYTEYALYAGILHTANPAKKIELAEALEMRNPQSQYMPQVRGPYFIALRQVGQSEKAALVAEQGLGTDPDNEDMLLAAADYYMQKGQDPNKVLTYSARLIEVMNTKPQPEGVSAEDWQKKKTLSLGLGYWMTGVTYSGQNKFADADKTLRLALPLIKGNDQLLAGALFHLGLANYKMEKIPDAIRFNDECAKIKSPFQAQALRNLKVIRSQYRVVK